MSSDQTSLYGQRRTKTTKGPDISNSSNLAFSSQLSSLIAQDSSTGRGRARPSKTPKTDLFTRSNKGAEKRAASDLKDEGHTQVHKSSKDIGKVDDATLSRSKRKMDAKVRLYNDLKKGSHLAAESSDEEEPSHKKTRGEDYHKRLRRKEKEGLVDFDRKWMDEERNRDGSEDTSDGDQDDDNASQISYEDEFGRSRRGTRKEAATAARAKEEANQGRETRERWQPARPDNLIYGETIQAEAFNPEENVAAQMAKLAARRDRSATPPEEVHYNADAEVRNRGTGFYSFSGDQEERKRQMEDLLMARQETEQQRQARIDRRAEWEEKTNRRRKELAELREKRMTERLLKGLSNDGLLVKQPKT
ncbi:uncharacterized protein N7484_006187 [Penicillium longicatenatum]|uniref:uncharacterized protein n=1 Tax=Penicillium longicatenatum TaxID=1561947 RepID=UPI00254990B5|nr:uncharacterized protein N7484_006187 [Penicillium longicatenatum]KAJ5643680.1 hypothetical protein N7484_006187 [Penicillium longicatenatum]